MTAPEHLALSLAVRPARVAVFIPPIRNWGFHCVHKAIEVLSRVWGGAGDILIPLTAQGEISEPFWRILKLFDADRYGVYSPTNRDFQIADPKGFEERCTKTIRANVERDPSLDEDRLRRDLASQEYLNEPIWHFELPEHVKTRLLRELSPVSDLGDLHLLHFHLNKGQTYDLVDLAAMSLPNAPPLIAFDTEGIPPLLSLMFADRVGAIDGEYERIMGENGRAVERVTLTDEHESDIIGIIGQGRVDDSRRRLRRDVMKSLGQEVQPDRSWQRDDGFLRFPLYQTQFTCEWRTSSIALRYQQPLIVIIGDTIEDYCLASALHRLTARAFWMPSEFATGNGEPGRSICDTLWRNVADRRRGPEGTDRVLVSSLSVPLSDLNDIVAKRRRGNHLGLDGEVKRPEELPILGVWRLFHSKLNGIQRYEPFLNQEMQTRLDTPIPMDCVEASRQAATWYVDVAIDKHQLPTRSCLNGQLYVGAKSSIQGLRCSAYGVSYFSESILTYSGSRPDERAQRPRLRCPDAFEVFQALLARDGMSIKVSNAGEYMQACIQRFDGFTKLAGAFKEESVAAILRQYSMDKPDERRGASAEVPIFLDSVGRWFLTLAGIEKVSGLPVDKSREIVDDWLGQSILDRGLLLKCSSCRYSGWYSIEDVGQHFRCQRCREETRLTQTAWKEPLSEPWWYYGLAEVVYQALREHVQAPVLTLAELSNGAKAFLYAPELEVRFGEEEKAKADAEVDLWAIIDGRIVIGEATTKSKLESTPKKEKERLARLCRIAQAATADEVVFATTSDTWESSTRQRIEGAFKNSGSSLRILEALGSK